MDKSEVLLQTDSLLGQTVKEARSYQKIQFKHLDTNKVEYLEYSEINGEAVYTNNHSKWRANCH